MGGKCERGVARWETVLNLPVRHSVTKQEKDLITHHRLSKNRPHGQYQRPAKNQEHNDKLDE